MANIPKLQATNFEDAKEKLCALLNSPTESLLDLSQIGSTDKFILRLEVFFEKASSAPIQLSQYVRVEGSMLRITPSPDLVIDLQSHVVNIKSVHRVKTQGAVASWRKRPTQEIPSLFTSCASWQKGARFFFQESDTIQLKHPQKFSTSAILTRSLPYLIGFSNLKGGHVLHGISDDQIIQGLQIPDPVKAKVELELLVSETFAKYFPKISVDVRLQEVETIENAKDLFVVILTTQPSERFVCPAGLCGFRYENSEIKRIPRSEWEPILFPTKPKPCLTSHCLGDQTPQNPDTWGCTFLLLVLLVLELLLLRGHYQSPKETKKLRPSIQLPF